MDKFFHSLASWFTGDKHLSLIKIGFISLLLIIGILLLNGDRMSTLISRLTQPETQLAKTKDALGPGPEGIIIKWKNGTSNIRRTQVLEKHKLAKHAEIQGLEMSITDISPEIDRQSLIADLEQDPDIEFAELDAVVTPTLIPNDPWYQNWENDKHQINTEAAWDKSTGNGITIAVLDSGVDCSHPDLLNQCVEGKNIATGSNDTTDTFGHGTKVAGVLAGKGNNGLGVAGVVWDAKILPILVTDISGATTYSRIANGIVYAADNSARIANVSFQVSGSKTVRSAAAYMKNKGGLVVTSSGNSGGPTNASADANMIVVSGVDMNEQSSPWSSYGNDVDISAPGCTGATTVIGGIYGSFCGTSNAAPEVSGVLALMWSLKPELTPDQITQVLFSSSKDLGVSGWDEHFGWGMLDAGQALTMASTQTAINTTSSTTTSQKGNYRRQK